MKIEFHKCNNTSFTLGDIEEGGTFRFTSDKEHIVRMVIKKNLQDSNHVTLNGNNVAGTIKSCESHNVGVFVVEGTFVVTRIIKEK